MQLQKKGEYIMVTFELDKTATLTDEEKKILKKAKGLPITFDEDSPKMTADMEEAFLAARKEKPYSGELLTLYVSPSTIEKVKSMGADYIAILGKLLDKAVAEYHVM